MLQQAALEVKTFKKQQSLVQMSPSGEAQAEPAPRWRSVEVWQGGEGVPMQGDRPDCAGSLSFRRGAGS